MKMSKKSLYIPTRSPRQIDAKFFQHPLKTKSAMVARLCNMIRISFFRVKFWGGGEMVGTRWIGVGVRGHNGSGWGRHLHHPLSYVGWRGHCPDVIFVNLGRLSTILGSSCLHIPEDSNVVPQRVREAPKCTKGSQGTPNGRQGIPKRRHEMTKGAQREPGRAHRDAKRRQREPKGTPMGTQGRPKGPPGVAKGHQETTPVDGNGWLRLSVGIHHGTVTGSGCARSLRNFQGKWVAGDV